MTFWSNSGLLSSTLMTKNVDVGVAEKKCDEKKVAFQEELAAKHARPSSLHRPTAHPNGNFS